jgi:glycosyltransferase involved in cell wall biosynthesis
MMPDQSPTRRPSGPVAAKMTSPTISVVIPTYNTAPLVVEAIDSALAQTLPPLEIVVVDDGSTDDTEARLASYGGRITYVRQPNAGVSSARNRGLGLARGEFVAFLDADDAWHPRKLELQADRLRADPGLGMLGTRAYLLPLARGATVDVGDERAPLEEVSWERLAVKNYFCASSVTVRRSVLDRVGVFDTALNGNEDRDLWLRIAAVSRAANLPLDLCGSRPLASSLSRKAGPIQENMLRLLRKLDAADAWAGRRDLRRRSYAHTYYSCSYLHHAANNHAESFRTLALSVAWHPWPFRRDEVPTSWSRPRRFAVFALRMLGLKEPEPPPPSLADASLAVPPASAANPKMVT